MKFAKEEKDGRANSIVICDLKNSGDRDSIFTANSLKKVQRFMITTKKKKKTKKLCNVQGWLKEWQFLCVLYMFMC